VVRKRVISVFVLPAQAALQDIAGIVSDLQIRAERESESARVTSLLDRFRANAKAVAGLQPTLEALTEGRIHELLYAEGMSWKGARCKTCRKIVINQTACPTCKENLFPIEDGLDLIIATALDSGANVERVRGPAAVDLLPSGGIGAFLRF
jgi:peptide subunit release factor 1 (eRF1)